MPNERRKVDGHQVRNKATGKVHAKSTTKAKAESQIRLLRGVEHGMVPRRKVKKAAKGVVVVGEPFGGGPKQAAGPAPVGRPTPVRTTHEVITGRKS